MNTLSIITPRLTLVPATVAHVQAEIDHRVEFARLIQATVPENWPPETTASALPLFLKWLKAAPDQIGWFGWYALTKGDSANPPVLIGSCGFLGPPRNGNLNIGYSVLPQFQRRGFATEAIGGLIKWAFEQPPVMRIIAETEWENPASVRVLNKLGFIAAGPTADQRGTRFELSRHV